MSKKKIGPTHTFPDGKLNPSDEGGLQIAMFIDENNVIINFNTPVAWLGLPKKEALGLAKDIIKIANELE